MPELRCEAVRWVDDEPFPGIVEVQFIDAEGQRWSLIDKSPIFAEFDELTPDSVYPVKVAVRCVIQDDVETLAGDEVVTVSTSPDGVTTPDGRDTFAVRTSQLIP
ncbi:hypothetical protein HEP86_35240 [Streptomyces sp. RPA4-5]|uniref:hypothetical protein n=1 Tax=unclassified Streptomyces TaxID=2593676 RepID=UPI00143EF0BD|nr:MULTISPECIES: hypothetical protein [unclassified Streptomyces]QIY58772.1 hypothetical protein HEP86_35240 [Streptomyces sp. RPA4-5]WJY42042.1 hypothetical protein QT196_35020 [Streptomyces sp. P9-2B-2]